jgi:hypothetical protein
LLLSIGLLSLAALAGSGCLAVGAGAGVAGGALAGYYYY